MPFSRRQLHALSRDPATLRRAVLLTAAVFILSAIWLGIIRPETPGPEGRADPRSNKIGEVLQVTVPDRTALLRALRGHAYAEARRRQDQGEPDNDFMGLPMLPASLPALFAVSTLPPGEQYIVLAWHEAILTGKVPPELIPQTAALTIASAPALPRTMAADLKRAARDYQGALADYEAIGAAPDGIEARRQAVALAENRGWPEVLARLLVQPAYYEAVHSVDDALSHRIAQEQLDVPMIYHRAWVYFTGGFRQIDYLILSLLTASVWFVSLHKACRLRRGLWWFSLAGVPLGIFSTVITLVLSSLQEARQGLTDSELAGPALLFQIAGVGLREEISKLLCFLPLCLLLLRRGTPAQALLAASCVGLGFALEENIGYYRIYGPSAVLTRYATATFMHIAMTGLAGLALFKFLRYPKNFGPLFGATFTGVVVLHGIYNFSQGGFDNPFSRELANLFPFIVAGLGWYYFQSIRQEQDDAPQLVSAEAVFLLGTTIVTGTLLSYLVHESGWASALTAFVPAALSSILFCWLFHHFLRNA